MTKRFPRLWFCLLAMAVSFAVRGEAQTLLLQYKYQEGSGTIVADSAPDPANATLDETNVAWITDTPSGTGSAVHLLGTSSGTSPDTIFVTPSPAKLDSLPSFIITIWMNLQATAAQFDRLLGFRSTSGGGVDWFFGTSGDTPTLNLNIAGSNITGPATTVGTNNWVFLAVVWDGFAVTTYRGDTATPVEQVGSPLFFGLGDTGISTGSLEIGNTGATVSDRAPNSYYSDTRIYTGIADDPLAFLEAVRLEGMVPVPEPNVMTLAAGSALLFAFILRRKQSPIAALAA